MRFKIVIDTVEEWYNIEDLENDDFKKFKSQEGSSGIKKLIEYLHGIQCDICADSVREAPNEKT